MKNLYRIEFEEITRGFVVIAAEDEQQAREYVLVGCGERSEPIEQSASIVNVRRLGGDDE